MKTPKLLKMLKKLRLKTNWPLALGLLAVFVYLATICFRLDPDFGWHLRVGEDFFENHIFPRTDFYTFPFQGYAWRDHEWLAEGPLWWVYHNFGYLPLVVIFSCLWFLPFWWLLREKNFTLKILVIMIALAAIAPFIGVRLQVLTLVGVALLMRLFEGYLSKPSAIPVFPLSSRPCWRDPFIIKRLPRLRQGEWLAMTNKGGLLRGGNKLLYLFPPIMLLWANLHGSFVFGLLTGGIFLIHCFFKDRRKAWYFSISYFLGLILTLLNPYGLGLWQEILVAANPAYKSLIAEWVNLFNLPVNYFVIGYLVFFLVFWLANFRAKLSFPTYYLVSVLIFLVLGIMSRRNITIFVLLSLPVFVELLRIDELLIKIKRRGLIIFIAEVVIANAVIISFTAQLLVLAGRENMFSGSYGSYPNTKIVSELKKLPEGTSVFASYDWGGFLIQSNPNIKVLIDGRASYWKLDGDLAVRKYINIVANQVDFRVAQERYGFEVVVAGGLSSEPCFDYIFQKDLSNSLWQDFSIRILKSGDWRLVTKNENNSQELFVLRGSQSDKLLSSATNISGVASNGSRNEEGQNNNN